MSILEQFIRRRNAPQVMVKRAFIILRAAKNQENHLIAKEVGVTTRTVTLWRTRWFQESSRIDAAIAGDCKDNKLEELILNLLSDNPRPGAPPDFTPEQVTQIIALACSPPRDCGVELSHWTPTALAQEAVKRNIVDSISPATVGRFLNEANLKPHRIRYWLTPQVKDLETFKREAQPICEAYQQAAQLHKQGTHLVSTDESPLQALERKSPDLPMKPGKVELHEYEYIRHGTQCLTANFEVATGEIITPTLDFTRKEEDFVTHIEKTVDTDPQANWIFVVDNLNTHMSESLVNWVAEQCNLSENLGKKGSRGILKSMETRKAYLSDPSHRIRFLYTPKHCSWLNQIEIWFSILVRRLLKRASFTSTDDLRNRVLKFIEYFNKTMAKPFKWTYSGKVLQI
jgi:transposase